MLLLCETAGGFGLLKLRGTRAAVPAEVEDLALGAENISLRKFKAFEDIGVATKEIVALQSGALSKRLRKFLLNHAKPDSVLLVSDKTLAANIKQELQLNVAVAPSCSALGRAVRERLHALLQDKVDLHQQSIALSHSIARYKIQYSPDKLDVSVLHGVGLLEDLDNETNNLAMNLKEWYGFHFPEFVKRVSDNLVFAEFVLHVGLRSNLQNVSSLEHINIDERLLQELKVLAESSMGSELSLADIECLKEVSNRVVSLFQYKMQLAEYLHARMQKIAPNLAHLLGDLLGAKLIAHSGGLLNLAKQPASTVQLLGAEKALFRALKSRSNTPKYGMLYHAKLVAQASTKLKGKMARIVANKAALCARADACGAPEECAKGTVDFHPHEMQLRSCVLRDVEDVFRLFGGQAIDTPVFELKKVLTGKYGEDSKLIYDLKDQGGEMLSLRYDLTVPFARYCATHAVEKIRRYQIGKVYRRDEPQVAKGRFREFYQCDFDIAGPGDALTADAEILRLLIFLLERMQRFVGDFCVRVNHRVLLEALFAQAGVEPAQFQPVASSIDKLDKLSWKEVAEELTCVKGVAAEVVEALRPLILVKEPVSNVCARLRQISSLVSDDACRAALDHMQQLGECVPSARLHFDCSLARGLDYYTGLIFEAELVHSETRLGSIAAGGRYDQLIGQFSGRAVPAVGVSLGLERIFRLLNERVGQ
uniref:Nucleolar protein 58-like n=1 Tax=Dermatophagoides pteronyssinus TaxID=6956 RepID=A0A6P6Y149_DERPT